MITFNNIVERFKIFADAHFFVKSFSFGSPDDVDLSKFTSFPLMHLVYTGATYDAGTKTYNLEVYILDVPADKTKKTDRQKEVVSDAEQCAEDIIADIKNGGNIFLFAQDYEVVNATTTPLEEETKNVLSGVLLDLSVSTPYEWDACNAPIDGVSPEGGDEVAYARRGILQMLTQDGSTDVLSVRTIKVTNGTLTDDGDGVVTLDTGGVDTLGALNDVDVSGVTNGQLIAYNSTTGNWEAADDAGGAEQLNDLTDVNLGLLEDREVLMYDGQEWVNDTVHKSDIGLGNVDNTSDDDKPVSTATQTALDAKADTSAVPSALNDLSDVSIVGTPTANEALIYDGTSGVFKSLPSFTNRFVDEAENNKQSIVPFAERVYTVKSDGDGIFIDPDPDTPSAGKVIKRKIYHKTGFLESGAVIGDFTLIHTFADDTAYSATVSTFEGFRDGDTYGTPPFTLIQTWEEVTAAPSFTGLLNESYGSGAEAAYSTRRLNGNVTDCMVIRRASDSTTTTIGFDGSGNIDESAIETFCTGTTCTVYQWLDQSGNGNDATAQSGQEPTIYTGGALVKENGKVAVDFDGGDLIDTGLNISGDLDTFSVIAIDGADTRAILLSDIGGSSGSYFLQSQSGSTSTGVTGTAFSVSNYYQNGASQTFSTRGDAFTKLSGQQNLISTDGTVSIAGSIGIPYNGIAGYKSQEIIFYNSDKSSVRTDIEENIGDYFTQNTPLLDTYSGAAAAYSLRLLDSSYVGSAVEVYNGSSYADIGFNVFGELDTVALAAHCGSNDGFVSTWYDQSGNSNDAAQATTSQMPKIYDGTTGVVTENGKPAVDFDGSNHRLTSAVNFTFSGANFMVGSNQSGSFEFASSIMEDGDNEIQMFFDARTSPKRLVRYTENAVVSFIDLDSQIPQGTQTLYAYNNDNGTLRGYVDGTAVTGTISFNSITATSIDLAFFASSQQVRIQECIWWSSDQSSNRTNIEDNINTFYSIY